MNKIGKWCLSVLLAVTMAMPVWAAQPADQAVYTQISASETDNVSQTEETGGLSTGEDGHRRDREIFDQGKRDRVRNRRNVPVGDKGA